ncbi:MAG: hypothetical protein JWQ14_2011 [Adhaeribacter sp.]|nr:hypothetical protein [Adhaeribacter sp.]
MVLEKTDEASLHQLNQYDCQEYLNKLRYSLGKEREKAILNQKRRIIHLIEDRLQKLNENG